tara:strand:+ start:354 stop:461 length:108 start_codon:yes stop_codon:yes gene_type:complete
MEDELKKMLNYRLNRDSEEAEVDPRREEYNRQLMQ